MTIKVTNEVPIYEQGGGKVNNLYQSNSPKIIVQSHWNDNERIHLFFVNPEMPGNTPIDIVVLADDLHAAINNATKTGKRW